MRRAGWPLGTPGVLWASRSRLVTVEGTEIPHKESTSIYGVITVRLSLLGGMNRFRSLQRVTWREGYLCGSSMKEDGL